MRVFSADQIKEQLPILGIEAGRFAPDQLVEHIEIQDDRVRLILTLGDSLLPHAPLIQDRYRSALEMIGEDRRIEFLVTHQREARLRKPKGVKKLLPVVSGKGGVGKSLVAVNLAFAYAQKGLKVGLLDGDIYGPSVPFMLKLHDEPNQQDGLFIPLEHAGVKVLSMGMLIPQEKAALWRGPLVQKAIAQLLFATHWGDLDVLVVDMPPGTGDIHLALTQLADLAGALVVTTPQALAQIDVKKSLSMFETLGVPVLGIVENMSSFLCPHCHEESTLFPRGPDWGDRVIARLPFDREIAKSAEEGTPLVLTSEVYKTLFGDIAQKVRERMK